MNINGARRTLLTQLRRCNSFLSSRVSTASTLPLSTQVTAHFYLLPSSLESSLVVPFNTHQKLYFSSRPNSIVQLLLANDWSTELENELENSDQTWTHETAVYVLMRLGSDGGKAWDFFNWVCQRDGFRPSSALYRLMLRKLVNNDSMKDFWIALRKMKEQGFHLDKETYMALVGALRSEKMQSQVMALKQFYEKMVQENAVDGLVKTVADVVLGAEWDDEVEKKLGAMGIAFTDDFVIRALKELRNCPSKVLKFFRWVGNCEGYEHNTNTYNGIAKVFARNDSTRDFWSIVGEMKDAGHQMDIDTYVKISRSFQKAKLLEDAVQLYEFMMDGPFKPSVQDCGILLRRIAADSNPDLSLVYRVVQKYESTGSSLSKAVYDGIHRSLTRVGNFDEAEKIMQTMRNAGYEPDNITYSQLIFGLCRARRFEEASKVLDEMEAGGCVPDIKTWTVLIKGHCDADRVDGALMCFATMMEKRYKPDADLLEVLVNGFISQKRIDGAYKLLVEMVNAARVVPWQSTYKLLIEKLLAVRNLEDALKVLQLMKKHNHPAYPEPFVQYISKVGSVEDAVDFLSALSAKGYPSASAYLHVFESFFKEGRYSEAKDLLYMCPHHIRTHSKICELFGSADGGKHVFVN